MDEKNKIDDVCELAHVHQDEVDKALALMPDDDEIITLSDSFKLLSDMSRLKIIFALLENELCVCDICGVVKMSQSAISHQLRILRSAHLVKYRKEGKLVYYSVDDSHVSDMIRLALEHKTHTEKTE